MGEAALLRALGAQVRDARSAPDRAGRWPADGQRVAVVTVGH